MAKPLVSICVPTYNRASLLRQSLRTICRQEYSPFELLISDNFSEDETESLCREIERADARVRYVRQPRNIGLFQNYNFCMEQSRGEFLCLFNDDDEYDAEIVSRYVAFLRDHPDVGIVCSDWELIDEEGVPLGARNSAAPPVTPGLEYIERTIRSGRSWINTPGTMIRRAALEGVRFEEREPTMFADFVVWFRIAETWAVGHVPERLWGYRLHCSSCSRRTVESSIADYRRNLTEYCDAHLARWPGHAGVVERWRRYGNRYLFWALAYEVALHCRQAGGRAQERARYRTVFELADYRLTEEEFARVLRELQAVQSGFDQRATLLAVLVLVRLGLTRPLGWLSSHVPQARAFLGLQ